MLKRIALLVSIFAILVSCGRDDRPVSKSEPVPVFRAAAGSACITPSRNLPLGGFKREKISEGVHDDIFARCLILESPTRKKLILVSLDLIGFLRHDVLLVKREVAKAGIDPDSVFICSTHQHSGPDTVGIWSNPKRDEEYMNELRARITALIIKTEKNLEPAELKLTLTNVGGLSENHRVPGEVDPILSGILVEKKKGRIATLVNFGCHPEALNRENYLITADFPGVLVSELESLIGGTALFVNGLLGGMVCIKDQNLVVKEPGFLKSTAFGLTLSRVFIGAMTISWPVRGDFSVQTETLAVPLKNDGFAQMAKVGKIPNSEQTYSNGQVFTEVSLVSFNNLRIAMIPGEMTPGLGLKIKALIKQSAPEAVVMMFGLANDEIGYILPGEDFNLPLYKYERTMSIGPDAGPMIYNAFHNMINPKKNK